MWLESLPPWLPWVMVAVVAWAVGLMTGIWLENRANRDDARRMRDQLNEANATIGHLYRDGERRMARLVTGGTDAA